MHVKMWIFINTGTVILTVQWILKMKKHINIIFSLVNSDTAGNSWRFSGTIISISQRCIHLKKLVSLPTYDWSFGLIDSSIQINSYMDKHTTQNNYVSWANILMYTFRLRIFFLSLICWAAIQQDCLNSELKTLIFNTYLLFSMNKHSQFQLVKIPKF